MPSIGLSCPVQQAGFDFGGHLAKAVHAALALFQAVRVPRQVVVQHAGEVLLQVDALAQAVGGNEDAQRCLAHLLDALFAHVVGQFTGDDLQVELGELLLEHRCKLLADIVGGGNVAAEDQGVQATREPILQDQLG
jgi:hypothetical protein